LAGGETVVLEAIAVVVEPVADLVGGAAPADALAPDAVDAEPLADVALAEVRVAELLAARLALALEDIFGGVRGVGRGDLVDFGRRRVGGVLGLRVRRVARLGQNTR
jgi:hypothetical protein